MIFFGRESSGCCEKAYNCGLFSFNGFSCLMTCARFALFIFLARDVRCRTACECRACVFIIGFRACIITCNRHFVPFCLWIVNLYCCAIYPITLLRNCNSYIMGSDIHYELHNNCIYIFINHYNIGIIRKSPHHPLRYNDFNVYRSTRRPTTPTGSQRRRSALFQNEY